jgi:hypothetical protein
MVTNLPKPRLDVNITNFVTLINFYVTSEGLSQNILNIVVANERPSVQSDYDKSVEAVFATVTKLKML